MMSDDRLHKSAPTTRNNSAAPTFTRQRVGNRVYINEARPHLGLKLSHHAFGGKIAQSSCIGIELKVMATSICGLCATHMPIFNLSRQRVFNVCGKGGGVS